MARFLNRNKEVFIRAVLSAIPQPKEAYNFHRDVQVIIQDGLDEIQPELLKKALSDKHIAQALKDNAALSHRYLVINLFHLVRAKIIDKLGPAVVNNYERDNKHQTGFQLFLGAANLRFPVSHSAVSDNWFEVLPETCKEKLLTFLFNYFCFIVQKHELEKNLKKTVDTINTFAQARERLPKSLHKYLPREPGETPPTLNLPSVIIDLEETMLRMGWSKK